MTVRLALVGALAVAALAGGCQREDRNPHAAKSETAPTPAVTDLYPGPKPTVVSDPRAKLYEGNAQHVANGSRLFRWYNCNGCHANGGGGMGPPLIDDTWRYGGSTEQIYSTIAQGRPNGMPAFGSKIPSAQIWELAAYIRSLSGNAPSNAEFSRRDAMTSLTPRNQTAPEKPKGGDGSSTQGPAQ